VGREEGDETDGAGTAGKSQHELTWSQHGPALRTR
jgi:hypothetical protein